MKITQDQKRVIQQVLNVFETGVVLGDYSNLTIFNDGRRFGRQITYGRSQTTEEGNLKQLVQMYTEANGQFSDSLKPYLSRIGAVPLADNTQFRALLRSAGKDPIMMEVQDKFFDSVYYEPAIDWAEENGFTFPLSALVAYDSFIHSGSVPMFLRKRFKEMPPAKGGDEKRWIEDYAEVRHAWLKGHAGLPQSSALRASSYRTKCLLNQIFNKNWDLTRFINANGVNVKGATNGPV